MNRTECEVAARAILGGTLGFRASLEVTEHARARALCSQLLPWLEQLNLGVPIEEFHHEILESPHGDLPPDSQTEAFWQGEGASLLGWAIQLFDEPDCNRSVDPGLLLSNLRILQPTAGELLSSARLRSQVEIEEYCAYCLTVRHELRLPTLSPEAQSAFNSIHEASLAELGLSEAYGRLSGVAVEAATLAATAPALRGLYVVRGMTAEWLLGMDE